MPCDSPLKGYRSKAVNPSGKRSIVFNPKEGFYDLPMDIPCGRCDGCKLERSRQWACRCLLEARESDWNCFITLTYDEDHLPEDGSLKKVDFQDFMKRLRERVQREPSEFRKDPGPVRYLHCGEYGHKFARPHYHALLFNCDFADKKLWKRENDNPVFTSVTLEKLWPSGFSTIGALTFESAAYVARYTLKKHHGAAKEFLYEGKQEEYATMSRRPGIGQRFYEKYKKEIFRNDFLVLRGIKMMPPKFFAGKFELESPAEYARVKARRKYLAGKNPENNTWDRMKARAIIRRQKTKLLVRKLEV